MKSTIAAEFKKLLTVRSTYVLIIIALALAGLTSYFGTGPIVTQEIRVSENSSVEVNSPPVPEQADSGQAPKPEEIITTISKDLPKETLISHLQDKLPVMAILISIAVVLLMSHEFRYNTISYTLTASNSRSKVLISKIIVSITFVIVATLLVFAVDAAATYAAVHFKGLYLPAQDYDWWYIGGRLMGYSVGFALMGLAIITLVRNQIFGVVALLILPMIDSIAAAILASRNIEATRLLPFSALNRVENIFRDIVPSDSVGSLNDSTSHLPATVVGAATAFIVYLVFVWAITWILFVRRDAN